MDTNRIRELLDQRDAIDEELKQIIGGEKKERKPVSCSICGGNHTARTCDKKKE